jgi:hypothetical protein
MAAKDGTILGTTLLNGFYAGGMVTQSRSILMLPLDDTIGVVLTDWLFEAAAAPPVGGTPLRTLMGMGT